VIQSQPALFKLIRKYAYIILGSATDLERLVRLLVSVLISNIPSLSSGLYIHISV